MMNKLSTLALLLAAMTAASSAATAETITLYDGSKKVGFKYGEFGSKGVLTDTGSSFTLEVSEDSDGSSGLFGTAGENMPKPVTFEAEGNMLRVVYKFLDGNEASNFILALSDKDDDGGEQYKFNVEPDMKGATELEDGFMEVLLPITADDADQRTEGGDAGFSSDGDGEANYDLTQWAIQSVWGQMNPLMVEVKAIEIVASPEP